MNTRYKIALATLAGIGIGAAAIHELHAQAMAWNDLPATKEITDARIKSTDSLSFIVEGVAN
jgi:hypothetical protein